MARAFNLHAFCYAHRGLWNDDGPPENSLAAFRAAAQMGLGVELDLRPSRDDVSMIFHDPVLDRMTSRAGPVEDMSADELMHFRLNETQETMPRLSDLLDVWPSHLPILSELKVDGQTDPREFALQVGLQLSMHDGPAAAMSFSEHAVRGLPEGLMRGQLLPPSSLVEQEWEGILERALSDGIDYLAPHISDAVGTREIVGVEGPPLLTWTVKSEEQLALAQQARAAIIFDHIDPALVLSPSLS